MRGTIVQLSVSDGGVPKLAVDAADVGELGLESDRQEHLEFHGGPDRALCLWAQEVIDDLAAEGHPIAPGSAGENVTLRGLDWSKMLPGVRLRLGADVVVEVTGFAVPCRSNARWFSDGDFSRIRHEKHPGLSRVYTRVVTPGRLRTGDAAERLGS